MRDFNYNIKIIKEFNIGEHRLPFLFSLNKLKAFRDEYIIVDSSCEGDYKVDQLKDMYKDRIFMYAYLDYIPIALDENTKEWLKDYDEHVDYVIQKDNIKIKSANMFFDFITLLQGDYNIDILANLNTFIFSAESDLRQAFYRNVLTDLQYFKDNDTTGSESTHTFSSLLGEVSPNPNPFFPENLGKATIDWSWREVELRDLYKSKTFKIENAIEKLKSKMMEDAKNKSNNNGR